MKTSRIVSIIVLVVLGIAFEKLRRNQFVRSLTVFLVRRFRSKVLPNQPVEWLQHYHKKEAILRSLQTTVNFEKRPNVLLILADDLGVNDLSGGLFGIQTPFIDSIVKNGINFTQGYASQAVCGPSRASLFTGRYPSSSGFEFSPVAKLFAQLMARPNSSPQSPQPIYHSDLYEEVPELFEIEMPKNIPTIAELLGEVGYRNYHVGKWDGGYHHQASPLARGFDESLCFLLGSSLYAKPEDPNIAIVKNNSFDATLKKIVPFKIALNDGPDFEPPEYMTEYLGKEASKLIEQLGRKRQEAQVLDDPWFMSVAFNAPHNPFQALKTDFERPEIQAIPSEIGQIYAAMILALDRNVGRISQALKDSNQYENTIIIFTSDNGAAPYVELPQLNAPYRGWKATLFEGGIRVPFFLQWPQKIREGNQQLSVPVMHVDILPTVLAAARRGIMKRSSNPGDSLTEKNTEEARQSLLTKVVTDGQDILTKQVFTNETTTRSLFWRSGHYKALRYGDYKLQIHENPPKRIWFHHLKLDLREQTNLLSLINTRYTTSEEQIQTKEDLEAHLQTYLQSHQDHTLIIQEIDSIETAPLEVLYHNLLAVYEKLREVDASQAQPLWSALVEVPVCIDKAIQMGSADCLLTDDYIIWAN